MRKINLPRPWFAAKLNAFGIDPETIQQTNETVASYSVGFNLSSGDWAQGGGRNFNSNDEINYIAPNLDSVVNLGGRGWVSDPNRIIGSRERNSYVNYIGYWPTGQTTIEGVVYDDFVLATALNPSANAELAGNIGGGDNFVGGLASANIWALHCKAGLYGNHSWNVATTYSIADGFYCGNLFGTDNTNYGNRSANIAAFSCRIGVQGTSTAEQAINSSLTRHALNIAADSSTIDTSYSINIGTRLSSSIRDFALNHGFGVSNEIYGGVTYGMAFNTRGDNQVTKVVLSKTVTLASPTTLSATGDWAYTAAATTQQRTNANGTIVLGQNTTLGITANIMAMQKGGTGYYRSRLEILARMDGSGTATLINATEYEKQTNKDTGTPETSWVVDCTVNATTGVVAIRFKGLTGETIIVNADCSIQRLRSFSPAVAIVPPIPFEVLS